MRLTESGSGVPSGESGNAQGFQSIFCALCRSGTAAGSACRAHTVNAHASSAPAVTPTAAITQVRRFMAPLTMC